MKKTGAAVFGSTGRLGRISLELLSSLKDDFEVLALLCNKNWQVLLEQIKVFKPRFAVVMDEESYRNAQSENQVIDTKILFNYEGINKLCELSELKVIILSVIGSVGFMILLQCLPYNKKILLANKESIVLGGKILKNELKKTNTQIIPLDSEHSSLMRLINAVNSNYIQNVYITASGGPFLHKNQDELDDIKPEEALRHPVWDMGARITIDSATLMNKAFEIIEAKYLFDIPVNKIRVIVHPESLFHAFLELKDGTALGLFHKPDMKIPILYGLYYPDNLDKIPYSATKEMAIDWAKIKNIQFHNDIKYKSIDLGYYAANNGHIFEIALNAADEVAVEHFIQRKIKFTDVVSIVEKIVKSISYREIGTIDDILCVDKEIKLRTIQLCRMY